MQVQQIGQNVNGRTYVRTTYDRKEKAVVKRRCKSSVGSNKNQK